MSKLMTLYKILPGCGEGDPDAWRAFLANYTPMALTLYRVYTPAAGETRLSHWKEAIEALSADSFAGIKKFTRMAEREFLIDLRAYLLDRVEPSIDPSQDAAEPPAPTSESLTALLTGLPVLHQEIAFLSFAGYTLESVESILRVTPKVAEEGLERLRASHAVLLERKTDACLWPAAWIAIGKAARASETKDCTPLRQLVRILDGQASWYDKSPAETHRTQCLHCLELWTSLREVTWWQRHCQPWPSDKVELLLYAIPVKAKAGKSSFFARMLGK
jgi:hypothetical protein